MRFIELNHVIRNGMITYKGLPGPSISEYISREESRNHYDPGTEFSISKIDMVGNTGTYIDSPYHRYPDGKDFESILLKDLAHLDGVVIRIPPEIQSIGIELFYEKNIKNKAVLINTGWSNNWGTDQYFNGEHPYITKEAAEYLVKEEVCIVGIDSYNIDDINDRSRPAHSILLKAEIPIIEHMCNLEKLPDSGFWFYAVPERIMGMASLPVRAFAMINK